MTDSQPHSSLVASSLSSLRNDVTFPKALLGALLSIVLLVIGRIVYNVYFHPLRKYPGPFWHRATDFASVLHSIKGDVVTNWTELHEKYGPVVRVGPNELSYASSQAWNDIYSSRPGIGQFPKYGGPKQNSEGFGDLNMVNANIENHSRYRKLVSHAFSDKAMREQEPIIQEYITLLMDKLHERSGQKLDISAWLNYATFDLTGDLAFSESFHCLAESRYHPWILLIFNNLKLMVFGNAARKVPGLTNLLMAMTPKKILEEGKAHMELAKEHANKRLAMKTDRKDIMSYIIAANGKENGMSVEEIQAQTYVIIIGGSETTATLLSGALYYLCKNPETMKKLKKEIRSAFTAESEINFANVSQLKYLLAVLNESLRIYPPVPGNLAREVPSPGASIDGKFVPAGTAVSVCHWATYHSSLNFKNPHTFAPERWMGSPEYSGDKKDAFQPFSFGPRNCVGRNLAYMEMRIILSRLLFNFDVELEKESEGWTEQKVYILWAKGPLYVKLTPRKS